MSVSEEEDLHYDTVVEYLLDGVVVPFLGAGANLCGRPDDVGWKKGVYMPSGAELAQVLAADNLIRYPDEDDRDLMRISQYAEVKLKQGGLYKKVRATLDACYPPTALHDFLARVAGILREKGAPRQVILTTNYDDALERAFAARKPPEPYELIWYEAKGRNAGLFVHLRDGVAQPIAVPNEYVEINPDETPVIVKLHGAMVPGKPAMDSYVITEDDYVKYLTRTDISRQLPKILQTRITEGALLFLGYSMRDWNLRVVLERLTGSAELEQLAWSVQRKPTRAASETIERTLWDSRKVDLRFVLLDEYVRMLDERLASMGISIS